MATHTSYLSSVFNSFKMVVDDSFKILKPRSDQFDAIAVKGVSGMLVGGALAYLLEKKLIVVRMEGQGQHSGLKVEGSDCEHYLIVDDFISTGKTITQILQAIESSPVVGKPIAVFTWDRVYPGRGVKEFKVTLPLWGNDGSVYLFD